MDYWNDHLTHIFEEVYGDLYRISPEQEMPIKYTTSPIQCICKFHGLKTEIISVKKCYNSCIQCNAHNYHDIYLDANSHRIIFSPQELSTIVFFGGSFSFFLLLNDFSRSQIIGGTVR